MFQYQLWFLFTKLPEGIDPTLFTVIVLRPIIASQDIVNRSNICRVNMYVNEHINDWMKLMCSNL